MQGKKILEVANYIVKNNATTEEVMEVFNMSRKTVQNYTNKYLLDYANETNDETIKQLYNLVQEVKKNQQSKSIKVDPKEVVNYIIEHKVPVEYAAEKFDVSIRTVRNYEKKIKEQDIELYNKLKKVQEDITLYGNVAGGKSGIREPKYTEFEAIEIAQTMIEQGLTITEAANKFGIPRTTLYGRIKDIKDDLINSQLQELFDENNERFGNRGM